MKTIIKTLGISVSACFLASVANAQEAPLSTSDLLQAVEEDRIVAQSEDSQVSIEREFQQNANQQEAAS